MTSIIMSLVASISITDASLINLKVEEQAKIYNLDPQMILAIIYTESRFNKKAIGKTHQERGLLQLNPRYHGMVPLDIDKNLEIGIKYLAKMKQLCYDRYKKYWPVCFNGGPNIKLNHPEKFSYIVKVNKIYDEISQQKEDLYRRAFASYRSTHSL